jgi:hypothetical protein
MKWRERKKEQFLVYLKGLAHYEPQNLKVILITISDTSSPKETG